MADIVASLTNPVALLIYLIGGGGLTTLVTAWFGWKRKREENAETKASLYVADKLTFDKLSAQVERLADLIEQAIEKYDLHMLVKSMKK
jgi:hypothetical protein